MQASWISLYVCCVNDIFAVVPSMKNLKKLFLHLFVFYLFVYIPLLKHDIIVRPNALLMYDTDYNEFIHLSCCIRFGIELFLLQILKL